MKSKKKQKNIKDLTAGYEQFIKGKEANDNGKELFDETLKKATQTKPIKPKPRGLK